MRKYTLAVSIFVHVSIVIAIIAAPILANDALPEPHRTVEFIEVRALPAPNLPRPASRVARRASDAANLHAAPVVAPDTISPESHRPPFETGGVEGVPDGLPSGVEGSLPSNIPAPPPQPEEPAAPLRVGGAIRQPQRVRYIEPIYPALAIAAHKEGTVILEAVIGEDGRVRNLRVLRSIPLLDNAAIDAVRQWQFTPSLLNGQPVAVVMTVTVTFTLSR